MSSIKVAFPYYGGKGRVAEAVWQHLGNPAYYHEPFAGGLSVLLQRPHVGKFEYVSDASGYITNFWRSVKQVPAQVANWADDPKNSIDLIARTKWLKSQKWTLLEHLKTDPDYYDPKIAGWWCWVICTNMSHQLRGGYTMSLNSFRGVHRERRTRNLYTFMRQLAERLEGVTISHGNWTTLAKTALYHAKERGGTAIFLDPPYTSQSGRMPQLYDTDSGVVGNYVKRWAVAVAKTTPQLQVALCGYAGEYEMPPDWEEIAWQSTNGRERERERIWFSPR